MHTVEECTLEREKSVLVVDTTNSHSTFCDNIYSQDILLPALLNLESAGQFTFQWTINDLKNLRMNI